MGLYNIFFGGSDKPRVTEKEFKKAKGDLFTKGFSKFKRAKIEEIFSPEYNIPGTDSHPRGLEDNEIKARIDWMRANKSKHGLSDKEIDEVEVSLRKRL